MKISIVTVTYNSSDFISHCLKSVKLQNYNNIEHIVIDGASTDNTLSILKNNKKQLSTLISEPDKGIYDAMNKGIKISTGDIILIQDADLEYNPEDYDNLIKPFLNANADVVYGSRFLGGQYVKLSFFWHYVANKALTTFCNIFTNLNMTDMETGYKLFKSEAIKSIELNEKSFGIEPEITIKLSKKKYIFYEVPISYSGRSYHEGKKIGLKDAFKAVYCIIRYRFFD